MSSTNRVRNLYYHQFYQSRGWNGPGWATVIDSGGMLANYSVFTASGLDQPAWRGLIKGGLNVTNFRQWHESPQSFPTCVWYVRTEDPSNPNFWFEGRGEGNWLSIPSIPNPSASVVQTTHDRCVSKFIQACEFARSAFQAGQDIGELKETLETIINPMHGLRDLTLSYIDRVKRIARGRKKGPSVSKALADAYLEYRFGWRPLAMDAADGIAHIRESHISPLSPVRASAFTPYSASFWEDTISNGAGAIHMPYRVVGSYHVYCMGGVRNGSNDSGLRPLSQELQLDLPHFLPTVWNLIPYSWIVDYFTNVGDMIDNFCFQRTNLSWGAIVTSSNVEITPQRAFFTPDASVKTIFATVNNSGGNMIWKTGTRSILTSDQLDISFHWDIPLSSRPWENIGALLTSRLA